MELEFDNPGVARKFLTPVEGSWEAWQEGLRRRPEFLGLCGGPEVEGCPGAPYRVGGFFVEPPESVVGLRPFDDALEGAIEVEEHDEPVPYAIFEVEKIVRMMLHQSVLAFEMLSTPWWLATSDRGEPCQRARWIVRCALAADLIEAYREQAAARIGDVEEGGELRRVVRELATAVALGEGRVSLQFDRLMEVVGGGPEEGSRRAERLAARLDDAARALSEEPRGYDALDEWLVERRLATGSRTD